MRPCLAAGRLLFLLPFWAAQGNSSMRWRNSLKISSSDEMILASRTILSENASIASRHRGYFERSSILTRFRFSLFILHSVQRQTPLRLLAERQPFGGAVVLQPFHKLKPQAIRRDKLLVSHHDTAI